MSRYRTKKVDAPSPILQDVAVSVYGFAMYIPSTDPPRVECQIVNTWELTNQPVEKGMKSRGPNFERSDFNFTAKELSDDGEHGSLKFLVVGYAYPGPVEKRNEFTKKVQGKQTAVGTADNPGTTVDLPEGKVPYIVVTQLVGETTSKGIVYHALFFLEDDLCYPHIITKEHCFFLPEFRNHATSKAARLKDWDQKIQEQAIRPHMLGEQSEKQIVYNRARDTTATVLPQSISFANEIVSLAEGFKQTGDVWHLECIQQALEEVENDMRYAEKPMNRGLRAVLDEGEFDSELAQAVLQELDKKGNLISADDFVRLRSAILWIMPETTVRYRILRPLLLVAIRRMNAHGSMNDEDLRELVRELCIDAESWLPETDGLPPISVDESRVAFQAIKNKLQEIIKIVQEYEDRLKRMVGDKGNESTIYDAWYHHADAIDTGATRAQFMAVYWFVIQRLRVREQGAREMIEYVVELMEKRLGV